MEIDGCDRFHDSTLNESRLAVRLARSPELDSSTIWDIEDPRELHLTSFFSMRKLSQGCGAGRVHAMTSCIMGANVSSSVHRPSGVLPNLAEPQFPHL